MPHILCIMRLVNFLLTFIFTGVTVSVFSQDTIPVRKPLKAITTYITTSEVPSLIMEKYNKEYPHRTLEVWNGYPQYLDKSDWFVCNPYLYNSINPKYYVVSFTNDEISFKIVYNIDGEKVAVHKSMNANTIKAIAKSILYSEYKNWKVTSAYEEIFNGDSIDNLVVYKIEVIKGDKLHYLFYKANGILIKDKEIR